MLSLKKLIDQHGEPDILIDSFNLKTKRYAIWGFSEILQIKNTGIYLNDKLIEGDFEKKFQNTINQWKKEQNGQQIACVGFVSYEFKNYIYNHINFNKKLDNNFPYLWFCKPTIIKEYDISISDQICIEEKLKLLKDIIPLKEYETKIDCIKNYLKNGEVYQINFTDKKILVSNCRDSFKLYNALRLIAKPEEGFFIKTDDFDILSLSPESFVKVAETSIR